MEPAGADLLRCSGCAQTYPVIEGIPVLFRDLAQADHFGLLAAAGPAEAIAALGAAGPDGSALPHMLEQLSSYLESWNTGFEALAEKLRGLPRVPLALELGCGAGRGLYELSKSAATVVGLDRSGSLLRAARGVLRGEEFHYARRMAGRSYTAAKVRAPARAANVELVCGDALDPPFAPETFARVVALNLLDNVRSPRALLHHVHQLAAPGAEILLSSPYAWRDGIVEEGERLGGPDPAAALREEVRGLGWKIEEEADLPWTLRRDERAQSLYRVHFVRARR